jgi:hypothetical protein
MAFTKKYKNLGEVLLAYRLQHQTVKFQITVKKTIPRRWLDDFNFDLEQIPYDVSEMAIREVLIFPILKLAWKPFSDYFTLWGHKAIEADDLSSVPDYIFAKKSELGRIIFEQPYVAVVEAKMDDFTSGWAQCALEMLAIQKLNQGLDIPVFGIVTNGETWQFAKLEQAQFIEFKDSYSLRNISEIIAALSTMFEFYKNIFEKNTPSVKTDS